MNTVRTVNPVTRTLMRSDTTQFNQNRETFHDVFQQTLNKNSSSRPPKIELSGILVPYHSEIQKKRCKFKLDTNSKEYFLSMNDGLATLAKRLEWEDVIVKGYLDPDLGLFEVEKINLSHEFLETWE